MLDLIERWQHAGRLLDGHADLPALSVAEIIANNRALYEVDIPALRALCEQHAAQLREMDCGYDECAMPSCLRLHEIADFLAGKATP